MELSELKERNKSQLKKDAATLKERLLSVLTQLNYDLELETDLDFDLIFRPSNKTDRFKGKSNEIHYGTDNRKLENLRVARKCLVHETIHEAGISHNEKMRSLNFYSSYPRDLFTNKVMEKLGWEPPTEEETKEHVKREGIRVPEKTLDYKYVAYCPECGERWYRKKRSKLIKRPERYYCRKCDTELRSRELTKAEKREVNLRWRV